MKVLVAIPVYNEEQYVCRVLSHVLEYADDVLVIDDASTDRTPELLKRFEPHITVMSRTENAGYGASMIDAFKFGAEHGYDWVITMDCDEQHEPTAIPRFVKAARASGADIVSGTRYPPVVTDENEGSPPADRRAINGSITEELNERLGLNLTDSFCGFKAYRVDAMRKLTLSETGYAFPMQFWVQAIANNLTIQEIPVRLIYNDPNRSFGGPLDDPTERMDHYQRVLHTELDACADRLPNAALVGVNVGADVGCRCDTQS